MRFTAIRTAACLALAALAALAALVAGCAVDRTSVLDDRGPIQTSFEDHFKVSVVAVDGVPRGPGQVTISPGPHDVTFAARPDLGTALPATKTIAMSIIPCTEYRMVARPGRASSQDWYVHIEDSSPTGDCASSGGGFATLGNSNQLGPNTSGRN